MSTPVRHIRIHDLVWEAAMAKARGEGRSASEVVVEQLERYAEVETPPREPRRRRETEPSPS